MTLRIGGTAIALDASWLVLGPLGVWVLASAYVPGLAPSLSAAAAWGVAVGTMLMVMVSVISHALVHAWTARVTGGHDSAPEVPARIPIYMFGDTAQVWPATSSPWHEVLVAVAGPIANLLLAGAAYLIWNLQLHPYLNVSAIFLAGFNLVLAIANLGPGFPLDGGRLTRAIVWGLLKRPAATSRLGLWIGRLMVLALAGWGLVLLAQRARFSMETGTGTLLLAGVLGLALWAQPAWDWDGPALPPGSTAPDSALLRLIAGLLILVLLGITWSLVPTNNGLEAPGIAMSVEPMIDVPPEYRHPHAGSFIATTVFPQPLITAGEWVYGQLNPVVKIVPPERIVPPDTTPQELAERGNRMLEDSENLAKVVALRLAGYEVEIIGKGAEVTSILPDSLANGILQPGDVIIEVNSEPIGTMTDLVEQIKAQDPHATIHLQIERAGRKVEVAVPLMPPSAPDEPPRLGITGQDAGFDVQLPFPVEIVPQKIAGGPSAGLMFTLTLYNVITPEDLTGGRRIAGTGTISLDGTVGPIGGVEQKVAGAEGTGAEYFLVPPENYEDARRVARRIKVVEVATAEEAIDFLRSLPATVEGTSSTRSSLEKRESDQK